MVRSISSMSAIMPSRVGFVVDRHLDAHAQARQRRAQVVRDAGQDQRAILVEPREVGVHLVEAARQRSRFRPGRLRPPAAAACRGRSRRRRAASAFSGRVMRNMTSQAPTSDSSQHRRAPAQPLQREDAFDAFARQGQPVVVALRIVDAEADEQRLLAFALQRQARVGAELCAAAVLARDAGRAGRAAARSGRPASAG